MTPSEPPRRRLTLAAHRWEVLVEHAAILEAVLRRCNGDLATAGGTVLKQGKVRTVWRIPLGAGGSWVAKAYPMLRGTDRLRHALGWGQAQQEWRVLVMLASRGVPVPRPVAIGLPRKPQGAAWVVEEEVPGGETLQDWLGRGEGDAAAERRVLDRCAALVARLHAEGLEHQDLHAGNILMARPPGGEGAVAPVVIDLHRARPSRMGAEARARNLGFLAYSLCRVLPVARVGGFLKHYTQHARIPWSRSWARRVLTAAVARFHAHAAGRTRRCVRESGEYAAVRLGGLSGFRLRTFSPEYLAAAIAQHRSLEAGRPGWIKEDAARKITRVDLPGGPGPLVVKEFRLSSSGKRLRHAVGHSDARRAWIAARACRVRGVEVPEGLAHLEGREEGGTAAGFVVSRWEAQARPLNEWAASALGQGGMGPEARREFVWALGRFLAHLHGRGVFHKDLKANNLLVRPRAAGGWDFLPIDLDRVEFRAGPVPEAGVMLNLAQLNAAVAAPVTRTDRLRVLKAVLSRLPLDRPLIRRWAARVMRLTRERHHFWP